MIDIAQIRERVEEVKKNINDRGMSVDVDRLLALDEQLKNHTQLIDAERQKRNENADVLKSVSDMKSEEAQKIIAGGKEIKAAISELETEERPLREEYMTLLKAVPNFSHPSVPSGESDAENQEIKTWGEPLEGEGLKDHVELGKEYDILDFDRGAEVAGSGFYYLKGEGALLDMKLMQTAMDHCVERGFEPMITPDLVHGEIVEGTGFNPRSDEEKQIYKIEGEDLNLIATAEIAVGGYFKDRLFEVGELDNPKKIVALSHCFRTEAGAYGKESKGLYRVHQFSKVEMYVVCKPEDSDAMLEELLEVEESLMQKIQIPYRVVNVCAGDMGAPAYKKYDIEGWMPHKGAYGEVTSTSNTTDYQSRRLNIKYVDENGKRQYVHTLNGTAIAATRVPLILIEQQLNTDQPLLGTLN